MKSQVSINHEPQLLKTGIASQFKQTLSKDAITESE